MEGSTNDAIQKGINEAVSHLMKVKGGHRRGGSAELAGSPPRLGAARIT